MTLEDIRAQHDGALMPTYGRFPVALESGRGATAVDVEGKRYIDFGSGIGVNALGYCDEGWVAAVREQAGKIQHISNLYYSPVQTAFAAELCAAAEMGRAFLCNSGAEANECAIKLARKASFDKYGKGRSTIVGLKNSFHGRTVTTLSATGQDSFHQIFFPFTEGFAFAEAGNLAALEAKLDDTVCAVMLECIQGEGGVHVLDRDYLQKVEALCRERDLLLIVDEVQTGAGRTGSFLASRGLGLSPDVVTMAKGLGGGLPIGACLCTPELGGVMSAGTHGSTFGGNPVACAAGRYMLSRLTSPALLEGVKQRGAYLRGKLSKTKGVAEVRGMGLMIGVALEQGEARAVAEDCLQNGLLVLTAKTVIRLLPPLNISQEELDKGLAILQAAIERTVK